MKNTVKKSLPSDQETAAPRVRRYLEQLPCLNDQIRSLQDEIKILTLKSYDIPSSVPGQDIRVVSSPPPEAPFAGTVMVKEAKEKELEATVLLRDRLRDQMFELIHKYTAGIPMTLLISHYIEGQTWARISQTIQHFAVRHLYRLRDAAEAQIVLPDDAIWINSLL